MTDNTAIMDEKRSKEDKNEAKLSQNSSEQFHLIADLLPQKIWTADSKGNVNYFNKRWLDYTKLSFEDLKDWGWKAIIHPDDWDENQRRWQQSINTGENFEFEHRFLHHTGIYKWHLSRGIPKKNETGDIELWVGTNTDIDEQKKLSFQLAKASEQLEKKVTLRTTELIIKNTQLEHSQSFLKQLIDSSKEIIIVLDTELKVITVNTEYEQLRNAKREDMLGKHIFDVNPKLEGSLQHDCTLKALKGEIVHLKKKKSIINPNIYIDTYYIPLVLQGKVEGVIVMSKDMTDIVKYERVLINKNDNLIKANKELESFNYIASHDLQEPLRKIQTFSSFILDMEEGRLSDISKSYFERIQAASYRMQTLIKALLSYSRINGEELKFELTDLSEVIDRIKINLEDIIKDRNVKIISENLPLMNGVSIQLEQLFCNLIENSIKYCRIDVSPTITISCETAKDVPSHLKRKAGYWRISVIDNGIGFEMQHSTKIFELFQRLHNRDVYDGTGLGLAICKKIVENHRGFIKANSIPDEGTTFEILIPKG